MTVSAGDDLDGANGTAVITHSLTSTDTDYHGLGIPDLTAREQDDDKVRVSQRSISVGEGVPGPTRWC